MKSYHSPKGRVRRSSTFAGFGERFPKSLPTHWRYSSRCYGFAILLRAIDALHGVRI